MNFEDFLNGDVEFVDSVFFEYDVSQQFINDYKDFCNNNLDNILGGIVELYDQECTLQLTLGQIKTQIDWVLSQNDNWLEYNDLLFIDVRKFEFMKFYIFTLFSSTSLVVLLHTISENIHPYLNCGNSSEWIDILFPTHQDPEILINLYRVNDIENIALKNHIKMHLLNTCKRNIDDNTIINKREFVNISFDKIKHFSCTFSNINFNKSKFKKLFCEGVPISVARKRAYLDFGEFNSRFKYGDIIEFDGILRKNRNKHFLGIDHIHNINISV